MCLQKLRATFYVGILLFCHLSRRPVLKRHRGVLLALLQTVLQGPFSNPRKPEDAAGRRHVPTASQQLHGTALGVDCVKDISSIQRKIVIYFLS